MTEAVLIVDDSLTVRMDLSETFQAAGFHTVACATLGEARLEIAREAFAIVLLDLLLPDGNGGEFLKEIRASSGGADSAVLMLSTEADAKDRIRGLEIGADEYVGKPYDTGYVVARAMELTHRKAAAPVGESQLVLIIDDSPTFRAALRFAFEAAGYEVREATSGEEGLRAAAALRPAAIVVDGVLPGIDGTTVIRRLRLDAALRSTPCLLLTGSQTGAAELDALDAGADAFVRKEEDTGVVLAKLTAVLRRTPGARHDGGAASLHGPKKILAVDDSSTYLDALGEALRGDGYDVALARSGEEALDLLGVHGVSCILLDLLMPGMGGKEACRRIKSVQALRDIPLILLTALDDRSAMLEGLGAGADDYISKSSDFSVLKARLRAQLRRRQFEDENRRFREELLQKEVEATEARFAREVAEARAAAADELARKNKELEAFSYSVSHDLRAPLRTIDGFSMALLEDYGDELEPRAKDYLGRVRGAALRMSHLIDDLLELSRVGRAELVRDRVDLSELAREVVAELRAAEPDREVEVTIGKNIATLGDKRLLRVVLVNLLGNAFKFTRRAKAARVAFEEEPGETVPVFCVRDNGAGFDPARAERLFGAFQRLHAESDFPGTGIGLATVLRIVDRHGGRIWAEAAVGVGAVFRFTLAASRRSS